VPFLIKLPGNVRGGERNIFYARNLDIAPTTLHFAGLPKGTMMQGQSLFNADNSYTNNTISFAYAENNFEGIVLRAVQSERGKVITANEDNKRGLAPVELYHVQEDPLEQTNLAGQPDWAAVETELLGAIDGYLKICEENAVEPAAAGEMSPELQDQLEALGYLGN
jgi:N-acetylglucosamine-6-sulfatase